MCVVFEGGERLRFMEWVMGIRDDTKLTMTSDPGLLLYLLCVFFFSPASAGADAFQF